MNLSDTLQQMTIARNWETVFSKLGIHSGFADRGKIRCPMPNHHDEHPSCDVILDAPQGPILVCRTQCAETITVTKLVMAYGAASTHGEALSWVDDAIGYERPKMQRSKPRELFADPSLTRAQYRDMKGLTDATLDKFGIVDVQTYVAGVGKDRSASFESGQYTAMFMPTNDGYRPRVRTYTSAKVKWAANITHLDGTREDYHRNNVDDRLPVCVYGIPQLAASADAPHTLLVVEGESDVHALHEMCFPACVGIPGTSMVSATASTLMEAVLALGEGSSKDVTVLVWQEPGAAGSGFPKDVAEALTRELSAIDMPLPAFATIAGSSIDGSPKDPSGLWLMQRDEALPLLLGAISEASGRTLHPAEVGTSKDKPALLPDSSPPAPALQRSSDDPWQSLLGLVDTPTDDAMPPGVQGIGVRFERSKEGWKEFRWVESKGEEVDKHICDPFLVEEVLECGEEVLVTIAAPMGSRWERRRMSYSHAADGGRTAVALLAQAVGISNRCRPSVSDLVVAQARRIIAAGNMRRIPGATGWSGEAGSSLFAGIECDCADEFGAWMFDANEDRRQRRPDTEAAAAEWWGVARQAIGEVDDARACHAAPYLALGASAAAPLLAPLKRYRIEIAPVVWIAGLGGGGKSVTQNLCASIFAPSRDNGQVAFKMGANISEAGLGVRSPSFRDLPCILDDVTQMPIRDKSAHSGLAGRVDTAAEVGMRLFNREPAQRSTRNSKARKAHPFRCTGLFSAEANLHDPSLRTAATAGNRRRIATVSAKPMHDRGLGSKYAQEVSRVSDDFGGAAGEQLVRLTRSLVASGDLSKRLSAASAAVHGVEVSRQTDPTQMQSLVVMALGFSLLAEACGGDFGESLASFVVALHPYLEARASDGGAVGSDDVDGVQRAKDGVLALFATYKNRFITPAKDGMEDAGLEFRVGFQSILGRLADGAKFKDGRSRLFLTQEAMTLLDAKFGVSPQMVESAIEDGCCLGRDRFRLGDVRPYGVGWFLSDLDGGERGGDDPEPPEPFNHDPKNLKKPLPEPEVDEDDDPEFERIFKPALPESAPTDLASTLDEQLEAHKADYEKLAQCDEPEESYDDFLATISAEYDARREAQLLEVIESLPASDAQRRVLMTKGASVTGTQSFNWATGTYTPRSGHLELSDESFLKVVVDDAWDELHALRDLYPKLHEANLIQDPPPHDDPRWPLLEAKGEANLRYLWEQARQALAEATAAEKDSDERIEAQAEHARLYRLHILARMAKPEWFIDA